MKFEHIAIWVSDLELMRNFYSNYFTMNCSEKYVNVKNQYSSYFLSFSNSETRLELMHRPDISEYAGEKGLFKGLTHLSIAAGSKEKVDELTETFRKDGYTIKSETRTSGDGYYESVILDPEGNLVEITE